MPHWRQVVDWGGGGGDLDMAVSDFTQIMSFSLRFDYLILQYTNILHIY